MALLRPPRALIPCFGLIALVTLHCSSSGSSDDDDDDDGGSGNGGQSGESALGGSSTRAGASMGARSGKGGTGATGGSGGDVGASGAGLEGGSAGAHDGEPDRDGRHSCHVHASPCNAVSVPRMANEGPSRSSALSRLSAATPAQRTATTALTVGALRFAGCAVLHNTRTAEPYRV